MLGKLLKYEMDAVGRRLMPLFAAWAATSVLLGLGVGRLDTEGDLFAILSILLYIAVTTAVFVMFLILIIQRYRNSLLGDEAYFNLTLPVSITEHLANKTLSALIWSVISTLAALVSVVLILLFSSGLKEFLNLNITAFLKQLYAGVTWQAVLIFIEVIVVGLFSIVKSILAIYAQSRTSRILSLLASPSGKDVVGVVVVVTVVETVVSIGAVVLVVVTAGSATVTVNVSLSEYIQYLFLHSSVGVIVIVYSPLVVLSKAEMSTTNKSG